MPARRVLALKILRPLGIRDFALLWSGMTISLLGDGFWFVALAWQVYELSNAPTALSVVGVAWFTPQLVFLLVGGVISDRFDRRRVMIAADVTRALAVGAIGVLSVTGAIELWHIFALVAVYGTGQSLFFPAFGALVPDIVPQELLVEANSLDNVVRPITVRLAGPALGGWVIAASSAGTAFLIDAASFGASIAALLLMRPRPLLREAAPGARAAFGEIREGLRFVRSQPWLWGTLLAAAIGLLASSGPTQVLVAYVVKNNLGGGPADLGLVLAAGGPAAILASLVMSQRGLPRRHMTFMYVSWAVATFVLAGYLFFTATWQAMIESFLASAGFTMGTIVWSTLMQSLVPRELLGRVSSLDYLVSFSLIPVSLALTGPIAGWVGARETMFGAGLIGGTVMLLFLVLVPGLRDTEKDGRLRPVGAPLRG